jgi:hypothetical protein
LNYIIRFYKQCVIKSNFNSECSAKTISENDEIPLDNINKCYFDSFEVTENVKSKTANPNNFKFYSKNTLLEKDNRKKEENMVSYLPSINVNNRNLWGSWTRDNIIEDICAAFLKKPEICYDEGFFKKPSEVSFMSMFVLYLVIIIVNLLIFLFCRYLIRRRIVERIESTDINHKINTVVTSYLALRDNK